MSYRYNGYSGYIALGTEDLKLVAMMWALLHDYVIICVVVCRCIHYGQARCRSQGAHPNQRHFALSCPVTITISFDQKVQNLVVRDSCLQHNYRVGPEILMHYPSHRCFTTTESKEIEGVLSLGANKKLVKQQIQKKFGKLTTLKDIQNIQVQAKKANRMVIGMHKLC